MKKYEKPFILHLGNAKVLIAGSGTRPSEAKWQKCYGQSVAGRSVNVNRA